MDEWIDRIPMYIYICVYKYVYVTVCVCRGLQRMDYSMILHGFRELP